MDNKKDIWIKREETDEFSENLFKTEKASLQIKQDPDHKLDLDGSEHNSLQDPLTVPWCTECINERRGLYSGWMKTENNSLQDPLTVPWCTECINEGHQLHLGWVKSENNNSVETLMNIILEEESNCCPPLLLVPKKEPESIKREIQNTTKQVTSVLVPLIPKEEPVEAPTRSTSYNTRLIQNTGERCGNSVEATTKEAEFCGKLKIGAEKSTQVSMCGAYTQEVMLQEDNSFSTRYSCSSSKKEFCEFNCSFCLQSFPSRYKLIMHVFTHIDGVQPPTYVCKSCGKVFSNNVSLNRHLRVSKNTQILPAGNHYNHICRDIHQNIIIFEGDIEVSIREQSEKQSEEVWKPSKNAFNDVRNTSTVIHTRKEPVRFDNSGNLYKTGNVKVNAVHHATRQPHSCDVCAKSFSRRSKLMKNITVHTGIGPHTNNSCGSASAQASSLNRHRVCCDEKQHKCDICGKYFARLSNLKMHALIHMGKKPHKCEICGKSFTQKGSLKVHTLIHTGQKHHTCDICGKCFTHLGTLKMHAFTHTGKKPHKCDVCGRSFTHKCSLKEHTLIHTGQKPHKCDVCGMTFRTRSHLRAHSLIHTGRKPYKCDICGKCFTQLVTLKGHTLIHSGIKAHKCGICEKSFRRLSAFRRHERIHSGKRPYVCNICGKAFTQSFNAKRHSLIHTRKQLHENDP